MSSSGIGSGEDWSFASRAPDETGASSSRLMEEPVDGFRLSPQQRHLWLSQQEVGSAAYSAQCAVLICGDLDRAVLEGALDRIVERHEILRTTFRAVPGIELPLQVIADTGSVTIEDSEGPALDLEGGTAALLEAAQRTTFDLATGPLLKVRLIRSGPERRLMLLTLPSLCGDEATLVNLVAELAGFYSPDGPLLEGLPMQYADVAEWQNELLEGESFETGREHWKKRGPGSAPLPRLPFERPSAPEVFRIQSLALPIGPATADRVREVADRYRWSEAAVLLACWQVLLCRITGETEVVLGVGFDGRRFEQLKNALGLFAKYLPLGGRLSKGASFHDVVSSLERDRRDAEKWQDHFSWDGIGSRSEAGGRRPFFPYCFDSEGPAATYAAGGVSLSIRSRLACFDRFKARLVFQRDDSAFRARLEYDPGFFDREDVERIGAQLATLIQSAVERPDAAAAELSLLGGSERHRIKQAASSDRARGLVHRRFEDQVHGFHVPGEMELSKRPPAVEEVLVTQREAEPGDKRLVDAPMPRGLGRVIEEIGSSPSFESPELERISREGPLAPSFAQERLWFLDQLNPGSAGYNVAEAARLVGPLDIDSLERSLEEIVRRHVPLRTRLVAADGRPMQVIDPPSSVQLPVEAIAPGRGADVISAERSVIHAAARRPFDLARGPLWRAGLLRIGPEEHVFFWVIHHIAFDGSSFGIFRRELSALYSAHRAGRGSPLPDLSIQYPDYAAWQRRRLKGGRLDGLLGFWRDRLQGLERLRLPTDRPRPSVQTYRGGRERFHLPPGLSRCLTELAWSEQVTPFIVLLAAFQALLSGYSGQEDVAVGTDVANRERVEFEDLIGFFVNLLVLRGDLSGNPTFRDLLRRTRKNALDAFGHQELPFDKVVEAVRPERSLSYTPLVSVLLVQNPPAPSLEMSGLTVEPLALDVGTARFDLALFVEQGQGGLEGTWNYNRDLFEAATVRKMSSDFLELLQRIGSDPDTRLDALRAIRTKERRKIMSSPEGKKPGIRGLQGARRRGVGLEEAVGVKRSFWNEARLPLVLEPAGDNVDLVAWAEQNRESLGKDLLEHGAVLFRGFDVPSPAEFERLAQTQCPQLFGEYGDLPREGVSGNVYGSTPYPADQWILFHNESSHMHRWPMKIFFYCVQASASGGETPIVDCRDLYRQLEPGVRERFLRMKLMYVRNYVEGLDVSWQSFFRTDDRAEVEAFCRKSGMDFEWTKNGGLRTRQVCDAVLRHPQTGETVFFNQIQLHHISFLPAAVRESLLSMLAMEDLPRNVYYGDGSPIEDSLVAQIHELSDRLSAKFPWRNGDIVMLNNMLVAHSRAPFAGPRKIVVAMGEMVEARDVSPPGTA